MSATAAISQVVEALDPALASGQRWFRHKDRVGDGFDVVDGWPVMNGDRLHGWWLLVSAKLRNDDTALYQIPVVLSGEPREGIARLGEIAGVSVRTLLLDGACDALMVGDLFDRISSHAAFPLKKGTVTAERFDAAKIRTASIQRVGGNSTNTLCRLDGNLLFKLYRCLDEGTKREAEMIAALTRADSDSVPAVRATVEYGGRDGGRWTLAIVQEWVAESRDAWSWLAERLAGGPVDCGEEIGRMARTVASTHRGLATIGSRPWTDDDTRAIKQRIRDRVAALQERHRVKEMPYLAFDLEATLIRTDLLSVREGGDLTPVHGDLHLGQLLRAGNRYLVIDFEGEPLATPEARLAWHSPLKDVAGMLRSFDYAAAFARKSGAPGTAREWSGWVGGAERAFLSAYFDAEGAQGKQYSGDRKALLSLYLVEKVTYEIAYELRSRPDWIDIPHDGLKRVLKNV